MSENPSANLLTNATSENVQEQYGALPWRTNRFGEIEILLITSRRRGRWIVPKGWRLKGRSDFLSAAQEAFEEAGVIGDIYPLPIGDYEYEKQRSDGSTQRRRVTLFSLRVRGTLLNWPERGERKRRWVTFDEAGELIVEPELVRLVRAIRSNRRILTRIDKGRPSVISSDNMHRLG